MKYFILSILALSILSCKGTKEAAMDDFAFEEATTPPATKEVAIERKGLNDAGGDDCYNDRKSLNSISNIAGRIEEIAGHFMIAVGDSKRYQPCSLPEMFQKPGTAVEFSGIIKEIFPGERRAGTPFVLTKINITM